ncbi:response regulator [bacterium]|nr:response regulator [bacterium]
MNLVEIGEREKVQRKKTLNPCRILIVDDDLSIRSLLQNLLNMKGYDVWTAEDALAAYQEIESINPQLIILDIRLPSVDGIDFLHILQNKNIHAKVIFMSAYDDMDIDRAFYMGAYDYIKKPFHPEEIIHSIEKVLNY